jgi:hypothetical protein
LELGTEYSLCAAKPDEGYLDPFFLPFGLSTGGQCKKITTSLLSEVDLVLAPKGGSVTGQVRDARSGNAITSAKVTIYRSLKFVHGAWTPVNPQEATYVPSSEASLEANGQFEIRGLPAGNYFLKIEVQGHKTWYFNNQSSDRAANRIVVQSGQARKININLP